MMNYSSFNTFLYGEEYPIIKCEQTDEINFWVKQTKENINCPKCNHCCIKIHETHKRKIQDTPIHNKNVYININVREFVCENKNCNIKTFTEELPFVGKNQVRTYALTEFIITHAIYMSSNSTSLILSFIGVNVSADTVDNILKKVNIVDNPNVERIGIDDVAIRKGIKYATAIYDLDTHHLIALLEGREKDDIVPWLKKHKKIKMVARDRASNYTEAINEILPKAIQVADRFHLFENLIKYLKDMFYSELPNKIIIKNNKILDKKATKVMSELTNIDENILNSFDYTNDFPIDKNGNEISFIDVEYDMNDEAHFAQAKRRIEKYNIAIQIKKDSKLNIAELSKKYKISHYLVRRYLKMSDKEIEQIKTKRNYNRKETEFSNYKNIVYKMLIDGQPFEYILAYILKQGYRKSPLILRRKIQAVASNNNINGYDDIEIKMYAKMEYSKDEIVITKRNLLKYLLTIKDNKLKDKVIESNIEIIKSKYKVVEQVQEIFKDFHNAVFSNDEKQLDIFIKKYRNILSSFTKGLKKDITAVKNAISNKINSGFVEGNNNKFKLIKRIVYGKQKICNLFKRSFLAFTSTLDDLSLLKLAIDPLIQNKKEKIFSH